MSFKVANPIGKKGEDIAVEYLKKKGYKILERNYRKKYAEIDIIAIDYRKSSTSHDPASLGSDRDFSLSNSPAGEESKGILVFIEVKTRTSSTFGTPLEAITPWKLRPLQKLAEYYSQTHPDLPKQLRIDAIGVTLNLELKIENIEHVENISGF